MTRAQGWFTGAFVSILLWVVIIALCSMLAGCGGPLNTWAMTGQRTDLVARVGAGGAFEVGGTVKYGTASGVKWGPEPDAVGAYCVVYPTWEATLEDTAQPAPWPIEWLGGLKAVPYGIFEIVDHIDDDNISDVRPNWGGGTKFLLGDDSNSAIVVEYLDGDQQSGDTFIGLKVSF